MSGDTAPSSTDSDLTATSQYVENMPREPNKNKTLSRAKRPNSAQRLLRRRHFHRGYFVRARYGAHARDAETPAAKQTIFRPPSAFCAPLRYAQEPRAVKARKQKPTNSSRWPEPPRYPPKARHVGVDCDILRLVEQLHVNVQCQPEVSDAAVWCALRMVDGSTQYPRVSHKDASVQTTTKTFSDRGVQNKPATRNRKVETSVRILYQPEIIESKRRRRLHNVVFKQTPLINDPPINNKTHNSLCYHCFRYTVTYCWRFHADMAHVEALIRLVHEELVDIREIIRCRPT